MTCCARRVGRDVHVAWIGSVASAPAQNGVLPDREWFDNPVYALRAGIILPLGPLAVDVNANFQFMSLKARENADSDDLDSVTFGATLWF